MNEQNNNIIGVRIIDPVAVSNAANAYRAIQEIITGDEIRISCKMLGTYNNVCAVVISGRNIKVSNRAVFDCVRKMAWRCLGSRSRKDNSEVFEFMFRLM